MKKGKGTSTVELCEKLQELRKRRGLTQEELAECLYVSRPAISKWESGRGYPNIDSLKAISCFFDVSIDDLLCGDKLLTLAQEEQKQHVKRLSELVFALVDCGAILLLLLPVFGNRLEMQVQAVTLPDFEPASPWIKLALFLMVAGLATAGAVNLFSQRLQMAVWEKHKTWLSVLLSIAGILLCILSRQPYAAILLFAFLIVKQILLLKSK